MSEEQGRKRFHLFQEFKDFISRGNVLDLGVGIIIGGAFSGVVNSFVNDILTPPLGLLVAGANLENWFYVIRAGQTPDAQYNTPAEAQADGAVTENVGHFVIQIINFILVGITLFFIITGANAIHRENVRKSKSSPVPGDTPTTQTCEWCKQTVPGSAVRCQFCTSNLNEKVPESLKAAKTANAALINFDGPQ